jgi:hypothetical protein
MEVKPDGTVALDAELDRDTATLLSAISVVARRLARNLNLLQQEIEGAK